MNANHAVNNEWCRGIEIFSYATIAATEISIGGMNLSVVIRKTGSAEYGQFVKMLICGVPGAGKTLISSTAPDVLFASAEGGLMSIADRGVRYADIKESGQLLALKNMMEQDEAVQREMLGFVAKTIVVDTIDEIQHILVQERLKETRQESLQIKDWGWLSEQMGAIIRGFRNLDAHVIFTCHLKETSDADSGRVWNKPGLQGGIADQIAGMMDLAVLLRGDTNTTLEDGKVVQKIVRVLQTTPEPLYPWIKDRSGKLPSQLDVNFVDDFERIHGFIFDGRPPIEESAEEADVNPTIIAEIPPVDETAVRQVPDQEESETAEPTVVETAPEEPISVPVEVVPAPLPAPVEPVQQQAGAVAVETKHSTPAEALPEPPKLECSVCGAGITQDEADLSRIRFRTIACRSCCKDLKNK